MRAKIFVTLKKGVLDPQGKAIHHAIQTLGYRSIADVRQGKYFELELSNTLDEAAARTEAERLAHEVLANPVIEDYHIELER
jgi:phosphoribosylformylglycinamidine synthase subunit PurS